jgi:predicted phage baseplate assembly protein
MSGPWWGKDVDPALATNAADAAEGLLAPLTATDPDAIARELDRRRLGFTPSWTSRRSDDAGNALLSVYAEQHAVLAAAIDDLPTKARVEHLRAAGVMRRAPRPLGATLQFEVSASAAGGVLVGEGFEVLGRDDKGTLVPFETERDLFAVPAKLAVVGRRKGGSIASLTIPSVSAPGTIYPFGLAPSPGVALYLGLDAAVVPAPRIAIGFVVQGTRGGPAPVSAGGLFAQPGAEPPRVSWELFDQGSFVPVEVIRDETRSFTQSGVVELNVPSGWRTGTPPGADPGQPLYWIRSQLLDGAWSDPPVLTLVSLNIVPARSGRTVRDEIVETPITIDPAAQRILQLAERPVLEGTLDVRIDEGGAQLVPWSAVGDLSQAGPDQRVFRFDAAAGTLTFGDELTGNGRPLPEGFRHVRASYRVAVEAGAVAAGAITTLVGSAPFLTSVTNLDPAAGGAQVESLDAALLRGPREIRARGRAVAVADYELLACRAPAADIRRAHAVGGHHPRFPGRALPGVVGVFVVGAPRKDGAPPDPSEATLQGVSAFLSAWAPRGAEIIAVAPLFHSVRVEASIEIAARADVTEATLAVSRALDTWFDPVVGGARGEGWPFGGTIHYDALVRFVLRTLEGAVIAIPKLRLVVDSVRLRHCQDVAIASHDLLWPAPHELIPLPKRSTL